MGNLKDYVREAFLKGYRTNDLGDVISPYNKKLSCNESSWGYRKFTIRNHIGERVSIYAHRLTAYQKYGEAMFDEGIQVRHLDGNPSNNKPDNIALGTQSQNIMDRPEDARKESAKHASSFIIKHDADKIRLIKQDRGMGMKYAELMIKYGITSKGTLSYIINHR